MVGIISNDGLGLLNGQLSGLGGSAGQSGQGATVNIATGNLIVQGADDVLVGVGVDSGLTRTYNSRGDFSDHNGDNWRIGFYRQLMIDPATDPDAAGDTGTGGGIGGVGVPAIPTPQPAMQRISADGHSSDYTHDVLSNTWQSPEGDGAHDTIHYDADADNGNGGYVWTEGSTGLQETYSTTGLLLQVNDPDGNTQRYGYDNNERLTSVTDASGQTLNLLYASDDVNSAAYHNLTSTTLNTTTGNNGSAITTVLQRTYYTYDAHNRLSSVQIDLTPDDRDISDANTYITHYQYDGDSTRITQITELHGSQANANGSPNSNAQVLAQLTITYDGLTQHVASITDGEGRTTTFDYSNPAATAVTDALGNTTTYTYDTQKRLTQVDSPAIDGLNASTSYVYDADDNITQINAPGGRTTAMSYDANGNVTQMIDAEGNIVDRTYNAFNQMTSQTVRPSAGQDQVSTLIYDDPTGGDDTVAATRRPRLIYTLSPEGRVTHNTYNTIGQLTHTRVFTQARYEHTDVTALTPTHSHLDDWQAQQDLSQTLLSEITYDFRGQIATQTQYQTLDNDGNGIQNAGESTSTMVYDARGRLIKSIQPNGSATTNNLNDYVSLMTYDGLDRLLTTTDALGHTTVTDYDDVNHQINIHTANGLVTTSTQNQNGEVISVSQQGEGSAAGTLGITTNTYDDNGRLLKTTDPTGIQTYTFYDERSRVIAVANTLGEIAETVYNDNNEVIKTIAYSTRLTAEQITNLNDTTNPNSAQDAAALDALRPPAQAEADRKTYMVYDELGRVVYTAVTTDQVLAYQGDELTGTTTAAIDDAGQGKVLVSRTLYDGKSQIIKTIAYALPADEALFDIPGGADDDTLNITATPGLDRESQSFYSDDGLVLAVVGPEGTVSETQYDDAGRPTETITYATLVDQTLLATGDLEQFRPAVTADDQHSYVFYDGKGQAVGALDAEGYLTETRYDLNGNVIETIAYEQQADIEQLSANHTQSFTLSDVQQSWEQPDWQKDFGQDWEGFIPGPSYQGQDQVADYLYVDDLNYGLSMRTGRQSDENAIYPSLLGERNYQYAAGQTIEWTYNTPVHIDDQWNILSIQNKPLDADSEADGSYRRHGVFMFNGEIHNQVIGGNSNTNGSQGILKENTDYVIRLTTLASGTQIEIFEKTSDGLVSITGAMTSDITDWGDYHAMMMTSSSDGTASLNTAVESIGYVESMREGSVTPTEHTQRSELSYDQNNRLVSERNVLDNSQTTYQYDNIGQLVSTTVSQREEDLSQTQVRTAQQRYDLQGRVTQELTPNGVAAIENGHLTYTEAWDQHSITHHYDLAGRLTHSVDQNGVSIHNYYDDTGRVIYTINDLGEVAQSQYNTFGEATNSITHSERIDVSLLQDTDGNSTLTGGLLSANQGVANLLALLDNDHPNNSTTQVQYDQRGLGTIVTDALGFTTSTAYSAFGELSQTISAISQADTTNPAPDGSLIASTREDRSVYDRRGLATMQVADVNGFAYTSAIQYDAFGRATQTVDANGNIRSSVYDRRGQVIQTIDPQNANRSSTYDAFGRTLTTTDGLGNTTTYQYDDINRSTRITTAAGNSNTTLTNVHGEQIQMIDGNGVEWNYFYDANGNLTHSVDGEGNVSESIYDHANRVITTLDANGFETLTEYDAANRILTTTLDPYGLNLTTTYTYDAKGQVIRMQDAEGHLTDTVFDNRGQTIAVVQDPNGLNLATVYTYDAQGNQVEINSGTQIQRNDDGSYVQNDNGQVEQTRLPERTVEYRFDSLNRRIQDIIDPYRPDPHTGEDRGLHLTTDYSYDANGNALSVTNPNGEVTRSYYDNRDQATLTIDPEGAVTETIYNEEGWVTQTIAYINTVDLSDPTILNNPPTEQDIRDRLVPDDAQDRINYFTYDADGRQVYAINPEGLVVHNTYDANNNVVFTVAYDQLIDTATLDATITNAAIQSLLEAATIDTDTGEIGELGGRNSHTIYDQNNRAILTVDPIGAVTETIYDGLGNVYQTIQYAEAIHAHELPVPASEADVRAGMDEVGAGSEPERRITTYLYDNANRLHYTINGVGDITENVYDAASQIIQTIQHAERVEDLSTLPGPRSNTDLTYADAGHGRVLEFGSKDDYYFANGITLAQGGSSIDNVPPPLDPVHTRENGVDYFLEHFNINDNTLYEIAAAFQGDHRIENGTFIADLGNPNGNGANHIYFQSYHTYSVSDTPFFSQEVTLNHIESFNSSFTRELVNVGLVQRHNQIHDVVFLSNGTVVSGFQDQAQEVLGNYQYGKTYLVEREIQGSSITTYVYEKNTERSEGWVVTQPEADNVAYDQVISQTIMKSQGGHHDHVEVVVDNIFVGRDREARDQAIADNQPIVQEMHLETFEDEQLGFFTIVKEPNGYYYVQDGELIFNNGDPNQPSRNDNITGERKISLAGGREYLVSREVTIDLINDSSDNQTEQLFGITSFGHDDLTHSRNKIGFGINGELFYRLGFESYNIGSYEYGKTYLIEQEISEIQIVTYVYEKGQLRSEGLSYTHTYSERQQNFIYNDEIGPFRQPNSYVDHTHVKIDNIFIGPDAATRDQAIANANGENSTSEPQNWHQDFSENGDGYHGAGLSSNPPAFLWNSDLEKLEVNPAATDYSADLSIRGDRLYSFDERVTLSADITVEQLANGESAIFGMIDSEDNAQGTQNAQYIWISGTPDGQLTADYFISFNGRLGSANFGIIDPAKEYRLEIETTATDSTFLFYEKGKNRYSGIYHTQSFYIIDAWHAYATTFHSNETSGNKVYFDNLAETYPADVVTPTTTEYREVTVFEQRFDDDINGWYGFENTTPRIFSHDSINDNLQIRGYGSTQDENGNTINGFSGIVRDDSHGFADATRFEQTFNIANSGGIASILGINDGSLTLGGQHQGHYVYLLNNTAYLYTPSGDPVTTRIGTLNYGEDYQLTIDTTETGSTLTLTGTLDGVAEQSYTHTQEHWNSGTIQGAMLIYTGHSYYTGQLSVDNYRETQVHAFEVAIPTDSSNTTPIRPAETRTRPDGPQPAEQRFTVSDDDRTTRFIYDRAGRQVYSIDALGHVVETRYDDAGNAIEQIAYANAIDIDSLPPAEVGSILPIDETNTPEETDASSNGWYEDFNDNDIDFATDGDINYFEHDDAQGQLLVHNQRLEQSGSEFQRYYSNQQANQDDGFVFRGEVTLEPNQNRQFVDVGVESLHAQNDADYRRHSLVFYNTGGNTFAYARNTIGTNYGYQYLGSFPEITSDITYTVEVHTHVNGSELRVYDKQTGSWDNALFSNFFNAEDFGDARAVIGTYGASGWGDQTTRIDNISLRATLDATIPSEATANTEPAAPPETVADLVALQLDADATLDQHTHTIYDGAGRARYNVDALGHVNESRYDANGNVLKNIAYAETIDPTLLLTEREMTPDDIVFFQNGGLWRQDFRQGFTTVEEFYAIPDQNDTIHWHDGHIDSVYADEALNFGVIASSNFYSLADKTVFRVEATPSESGEDHIYIGIDDGTAASTHPQTYRRHQVVFLNGELYAHWRNPEAPNWPLVKITNGAGLSTYKTDATYVVEVATDPAAGTTLYVYEKGTSRDDVTTWTHQLDYTDWEQIRSTTFNFSNTGSPNTTFVLDNLSEQTRLTTGDPTDYDIDTSAARENRFVYDERDQLRFSIDALGFVTESIFDTYGQIVATVKYANPVEFPGVAVEQWPERNQAQYNDPTAYPLGYPSIGDVPTEADMDAVLEQLADQTRDQYTELTYDVMGRETSLTDALGYTELYGYSVYGDKTSFTNKKGDTWSFEFDDAGRLAQEYTPEVYLAAARGDDYWYQDFASDDSGLVGLDAAKDQGVVSYAEGSGQLQLQSSSQVTTAWTDMSGLRDYGFAEEETVFYGQFTPGSATGGLRFGAQNDGDLDAGSYRLHSAEIIGNEVYAYYADTTVIEEDANNNGIIENSERETIWELKRSASLGTLDPNTSYEIELINHGSGTSLYVFETGKTRQQGITHDLGHTDWTNIRSYLSTYSTGIDSVPHTVVDALGEASPYGTIQTRMEYNAFGEVVERIEAYETAEQRTSYYGYDHVGRQVETGFPEMDIYQYGNDNTIVDSPETFTTYDAFGNAVVNRDVGGKYSHKIYDITGRIQYEIDAEGYVTEYRLDAFSNQEQLVRYANKLTVNSQRPQAFSIAEVEQALSTSQNDRALTNEFDQLNRQTKTIEPEVYAFDSSVDVSQAGFTASPTTTYTYDSFGNVVQQSQLKNSNTDQWIDTYSYFNKRNEKTAQIDPEGYLTEWGFDGFGNNIRQIEYAQALSGTGDQTYTINGYGLAAYEAATYGEFTSDDSPYVHWRESFDYIESDPDEREEDDDAGKNRFAGDWDAEPPYFSIDENGQLIVNAREGDLPADSDTPAVTYPKLSTTGEDELDISHLRNMQDGVIYKTELGFDGAGTGDFLLYGFGNGEDYGTTLHQGHYAKTVFEHDRQGELTDASDNPIASVSLYSVVITTDGIEETYLGQLDASTTTEQAAYVFEIITNENGSTLYAYRKGARRDFGFSHSQTDLNTGLFSTNLYTRDGFVDERGSGVDGDQPDGENDQEGVGHIEIYEMGEFDARYPDYGFRDHNGEGVLASDQRTFRQDREMIYDYDQLNQKLVETQVGVDYEEMFVDSEGKITFNHVQRDLSTFNQYDAVGNAVGVTDAEGATTFTYYDALGRITAVSEPTRISERVGAQLNLSPLTIENTGSGDNQRTLITWVPVPLSGLQPEFYIRPAGSDAEWEELVITKAGNQLLVDVSAYPTDQYEYDLRYVKPKSSTETEIFIQGVGEIEFTTNTTQGSRNTVATENDIAYAASISHQRNGFSSYTTRMTVRWPDQSVLGEGTYRIVATYVASDGSTQTIEKVFGPGEASKGATFNLPHYVSSTHAIRDINVYKTTADSDQEEIQILGDRDDGLVSKWMAIEGNTQGLTAIVVDGDTTLDVVHMGNGVYAADISALGAGNHSYTTVGTSSSAEATKVHFEVAGYSFGSNRLSFLENQQRTRVEIHKQQYWKTGCCDRHRWRGTNKAFAFWDALSVYGEGNVNVKLGLLKKNRHSSRRTFTENYGAQNAYAANEHVQYRTRDKSRSRSKHVKLLSINRVQVYKEIQGEQFLAVDTYGSADTFRFEMFNMPDDVDNVVFRYKPRGQDVEFAQRDMFKLGRGAFGMFYDDLRAGEYDYQFFATRTIEETDEDGNVIYDEYGNPETRREGVDITSIGGDSTGLYDSFTHADDEPLYLRRGTDSAPELLVGENIDIFTPLTSFKLDAFGNAVEQVKHATGTAEATVERYRQPGADLLNDQVTRKAYDSYSREVVSVDGEGHATYTTYDAYGNVAKVTTPFVDALGNQRAKTSIHEYTALGQVKSNQMVFEADSLYVDDSDDNEGNNSANAQHTATEQMAYDAFGSVVFKGIREHNGIEGLGQGWQEYYRYDNAGRLVLTNDKDGVDKFTLYNLQGKGTAQVASPTVNLSSYRNTDISTLASITSGNATHYHRTETVYNDIGQTLEQRLPDLMQTYHYGYIYGSGNNSYSYNYQQTQRDLVQKQTVDRWGNVLTSTDAYYSNQTNSYYDNLRTNEYRYDSRGNLVTEIKPNVTGITKDYQGNGQSYTQEAINKPTTHYAYNIYGNQIAKLDANGHLTAQEYDAAGQIVKEHRADGTSTAKVYDIFGREIQMVNARGRVTIKNYDRADRMVTQIGAMGTEVQYRYDALGQVINEIVRVDAPGADNALYAVTRKVYDGAGWLLKEISAGQTFDANGYSVVDNSSVTKTWQYDRRGNKAYEHTGIHNQTWVHDDFGRATSQVDLGEQHIQMSYDYKGRMTRQYSYYETTTTNNNGQTTTTRTANQDMRTSYTTHDKVNVIDDYSTLNLSASSNGQPTRRTAYTYDRVGNRITENQFANNRIVRSQNNRYDQHNRLNSVFLHDGNYNTRDNLNLNYRYDAVGNKRRVEGYKYTGEYTTETYTYTYNGQEYSYDYRSYVREDIDLWYRFDAMDRMLVTQGVYNAQTKQLEINPEQGIILAYDKNGNRQEIVQYQQITHAAYEPDNPKHVVVDQDDQPIVPKPSRVEAIPEDAKVLAKVQETYYVDDEDRLSSIFRDGRLKQRRIYDFASRVELQLDYDRPGTPTSKRTTRYYNDGRVNVVESEAPKAVGGEYYKSNITSYVYDAAGNVVRHSSSDKLEDGGSAGNDKTYTYNYWLTGSYVERQIYGRGAGGDRDTIQYHDAYGNVVRFQERSPSGGDGHYSTRAARLGDYTGSLKQDRQFTVTSQGQFLKKVEDGDTLEYYYANDKQIGKFGENAGEQINDFDANYQPINSNYPNTAPGRVIVRAGDDLRSIALQAFGDASLWYLIAEANGLSGNEGLQPGRSLIIPNKTANVRNAFDTFKPINTAEIIGPTTPDLPAPKPPGCNYLAIIIVAIVAVVLTIVTAGAAAAVIGPTIAGFGFLASAAAGAVAGAVASIGSQLVGQALGTQEDFSWKQVGIGALTGAVGGAFNGVQGLDGARTAGLVGQNASTSVRVAGAVAENAINQGIKIGLGEQDGFSWGSIATSAIMAGTGGASGLTSQNGGAGAAAGRIGASMFNSIAGTALTKGIDGDRVTYGKENIKRKEQGKSYQKGGEMHFAQVAADAFGNAIGSEIATEIHIEIGQTQFTDDQKAYQQELRDGGSSRRDAYNYTRDNPRAAKLYALAKQLDAQQAIGGPNSNTEKEAQIQRQEKAEVKAVSDPEVVSSSPDMRKASEVRGNGKTNPDMMLASADPNAQLPGNMQTMSDALTPEQEALYNSSIATEKRPSRARQSESERLARLEQQRAPNSAVIEQPPTSEEIAARREALVDQKLQQLGEGKLSVKNSKYSVYFDPDNNKPSAKYAKLLDAYHVDTFDSFGMGLDDVPPMITFDDDKIQNNVSSNLDTSLDQEIPNVLLTFSEDATYQEKVDAIFLTVGGRADKSEYIRLIDLVAEGNLTIDVGGAYAQSDAGAVKVWAESAIAQQQDTKIDMYLEMDKHLVSPDPRDDFLMSASMEAHLKENIYKNISFASDELAPERLRNDAQNSLLIEAVGAAGAGGIAALAKATKLIKLVRAGRRVQLSQIRALKQLGVSKVDRRAFFNGNTVQFSFPTKGGDDVFGFLHHADGKLTSQLFSISNTSGGAPAAFKKFLSESRALGNSLGAKKLEIQGGSVINSDIEAGLLKRGFERKTVPVPEALGGGTQEVLFKIFDLFN